MKVRQLLASVVLAAIGAALWLYVPENPKFLAFLGAGFAAGLLGMKPWAGPVLVAVPFGYWIIHVIEGRLRASSYGILVHVVFMAAITALACWLGAVIRKRRVPPTPGLLSR
jgi:hypothetical protein